MTRPGLHVLVVCAAVTGCTSQPAAAGAAEHLATTQPTAPAASSTASAHCADHPTLPAAQPLPGKSLYHLRATLTDQRGATRALDSFRGEPLLVTMFYASCTSICPMLVGQLKHVEDSLSPAERARARILLVSLDPERDTVPVLLALAERHGVDGLRWSFARTPENTVRELSALLGIRYRRLDDGEISHSPVISLLDRDGIVVARGDGPLAELDPLVAKLRGLLASPNGA